MLALIASRVPHPAEETADRDPGFLTLAIVLVGLACRQWNEAFARHCELLSRAGGVTPL